MAKAVPPAAISLAAIGGEIRAGGGRVTTPRVHVLALLRAAPGALSHPEIEGALARQGLAVDRVTIYRVLDWLTAAGLALRAADGHGTFRFSATAGTGPHGRHAHFRCTDCGGVFCLDAPLPPPPKVPRGFQVDGAEYDVRGRCPGCRKT
jgi:Fur family ferric uptake transcriptional regulator